MYIRHFLSIESTWFGACLFWCININIETLHRNITLNETLNVKDF